jgi:hypothetical protein
MIIVATASLVVLPWLVYCQLVWGHPMPQSGVATSTGLLGHVSLPRLIRYLAISLVPTFFLKVRTMLDVLPAAVLAAGMIAAVGAVTVWRLRDRQAAIEKSSRLVLAALAATCVLLLAYYEFISGAGQFFNRYFVPMKLLVLILVALFAVHAVDRYRLGRGGKAAILALSLAAVGSNLYWVWRDYGLPYRSYLGYEAYHIARSPLGQGSSRIGAPESGRLGFLYPARIVNLDGKMRVDALRAMQGNTMDTFIRRADLDYLLLSDEFIALYDKTAPRWRDDFKQVGELGFLHVFARTAKGR